MRLHVRAPPGTRIETTQADFAQVESDHPPTRRPQQISVILDNIGLPYSGINISLSDSATVGPMDGEILISLNEKHSPTAALTAMLVASCRSASPNCSSSSSPPTSSTRC